MIRSPWLLVAIGSFLVGAAFGYLARGTTGRTSASAGPATGLTGSNATEGMHTARGNSMKTRRREAADETSENAFSRLESVRFLAGVRKEMELQLADWTQALGLSQTQVDQLRGVIDRTMTDATAAASEEDFGGPWLEGKALAEALELLMNETQRQRWHDWQEQRQTLRAEARATEALAEISGTLMLDENQQSAVRMMLLDKAGSKPEIPSPPANPFAISPEVMAEVQMRLGPNIEDSASFDQVARQVVGEIIEREVAYLREVLRPEQIEAYRRMLTRRHASWLELEP